MTDPAAWVPFLLFLHVLGAVAGLGPTFAFAKITALGRTEPVHSPFAVKVVRGIVRGLTVPLALLTFATGAAMVVILGYDLTRARWLLVSIVLFAISFTYAATVQNRDLVRIIEVTSRGTPPTEAEALELAARRRRVRSGGMFMRASVATILFLMILKPL